MLEFFKKCLKTNEGVLKFCNMNSDEEYDFSAKDVKFLSIHVRSGNPIHEFTEEDIKEIICPLDMNFQKTVNEMGAYYNTLKEEKKKTMAGFYKQAQPQPKASKTSTNFLKMTYQRTFQAADPTNENNYNDLNIRDRRE